jgi:hypothetical protein
MNLDELFGPKMVRNHKDTKLSKTLDDLLGIGSESTKKSDHSPPKANDQDNDSRRSSVARSARRNSNNSSEGKDAGPGKGHPAPIPSDRSDRTFSRPTTRHGRLDSSSERTAEKHNTRLDDNGNGKNNLSGHQANGMLFAALRKSSIFTLAKTKI